MSPSILSAEQRARVEKAHPMVDRLARMMAPRLARMSEDDLRSIGYEALVGCGLRYDPAMGSSFTTFSYHRVRGAMIDAARRAVPGLRRRSRALRALETTQALLERAQKREQGDGPDPRSLEERVKVVADLVAQATTAVMLSSSTAKDPETVADGRTSDLDTALDDARLKAKLRRVLDRSCNEEERALIQALYIDGTSMTDLAKAMGCNKSTVSRRHGALLKRLSDAMAEDRVSGA